MANHERRKGLEGEREVAAIWRAHGFEVRELEGEGDHMVIRVPVDRGWITQAEREAPAGAVSVVAWRPDRGKWWAVPVDRGPYRAQPLYFHSEVKRQNRLRTEWITQAEREAPAGTVPVVAWRPDRGKWWAMIPLEDLARLLA